MSVSEPVEILRAFDELIEAASHGEQASEVDLEPPLQEDATRLILRQYRPDGACDWLTPLWARCNGGTVGGLYFMPLNEAYLYSSDILAIHNWGSGDFDCVVLDGHLRGSVCFTNHQSNVRSTVAESVHDWLHALAEELRRRGEVRHPKDYADSGDRKGVYSHVAEDLKDVNCELTRWLGRRG